MTRQRQVPSFQAARNSSCKNRGVRLDPSYVVNYISLLIIVRPGATYDENVRLILDVELSQYSFFSQIRNHLSRHLGA